MEARIRLNLYKSLDLSLKCLRGHENDEVAVPNCPFGAKLLGFGWEEDVNVAFGCHQHSQPHCAETEHVGQVSLLVEGLSPYVSFLPYLIWPKTPVKSICWTAHIPEVNDTKCLWQHDNHHQCVHQQFGAKHSNGNEEADVFRVVYQQVETVANQCKAEDHQEPVAHQCIPQRLLIATLLQLKILFLKYPINRIPINAMTQILTMISAQ